MTRTIDERASAYRDVLLQLCASLTLCETIGDVSDDVRIVLERVGVVLDTDGMDDDWATTVRAALRALGVTTLQGTYL